MAFLPQNDTGTVEGANAYIDEAYYTQYHQERGNAQPAQPRVDIPAAIILATQMIDLSIETRLPGVRLALGQTTALPRYNAPYAGLPATLKHAVAELALRARQAPLTNDLAAVVEVEAVVKRVKEKVGPLEEETEYATGADAGELRQAPSFPMVDLLLRPLLGSQQGGTYR